MPQPHLTDSVPSSSISFSTSPSLRNSSSERNRSQLRFLYFLTNWHGLPDSGATPHDSAA